MKNKLWLTACAWLALSVSAIAAEQPLDDPAQETRAEALFHMIRCVACQSQSLAESPADIATELRNLVRERVAAGDSDEDIKDLLTSRYGDKVLMSTRLTAATAVLWFGPIAFLAAAFLLAWFFLRREASSKS